MKDREWKVPNHPTKKSHNYSSQSLFFLRKMPIIRFEGCFIIILRQMFHFSKDKEISKNEEAFHPD